MIVLTVQAKLSATPNIVFASTDTPLPAGLLDGSLMPSTELAGIATLALRTPEPETPSAPISIQAPTRTLAAAPTLSPTAGGVTRTPTITPTPIYPNADIFIRQPGPMSRLTTPIRISGWVQPGLDGRVHIELLGEDGRLLARKVLIYGPDAERISLVEELDFEISAVAEMARVQIITYDVYGRVLALAAQEIVLLSMGNDDLNPAGNFLDTVIIQEPFPNKLIQGGELIVSGLVQAPADKVFLVELTAADKKLTGYRQLFVAAAPDVEYTPFTIDVPYLVTSPTWVRLTVKELSSSRMSGPVYATSIEILLGP